MWSQPVGSRWGWVACGGLAAVAAVVWSVSGALRPEPEWRRYLDAHYQMLDPARELPGLRGEWLRRVVEVQALARRPMWTDSELQYLTKLVREGYPRSLRERHLTEDEWGAYDVSSEASACMAFRLHAGAPLPKDGESRIFACWLEELEEQFAERRQAAGSRLISLKAIEDPYARRAVEALLDDPDTETRETIAFQLSHYDDQKAKWMTYKSKRSNASGSRR